MEKKYWIGRKRSAMAMAQGATTAEARLIHYELAGRYSIKAAHCLPFLQAGRPQPEGSRPAIPCPTAPAPLPPVVMSARQQGEPSARREPVRSRGEAR
jgi:hypothetical protein